MTDNPQAEPVNPCTRGASFCGQHGYECPPSAPADRAAILREAADAVAADTEIHIRYGSATDYANRHADLLRRMADEAQQAEAVLDRMAILREEAVKLIGDCPDHSLNGGALQSCQCEAAGVLLGATKDEAQPTP